MEFANSVRCYSNPTDKASLSRPRSSPASFPAIPPATSRSTVPPLLGSLHESDQIVRDVGTKIELMLRAGT
ncbi:hypothetical protein, partial [Azospirillum sp. B21]|uniref:hypothetical protein n=1 Tax=Azospirillum sp. B21 TaxID=2607496 RepID=UPI001B3BE6A8